MAWLGLGGSSIGLRIWSRRQEAGVNALPDPSEDPFEANECEVRISAQMVGFPLGYDSAESVPSNACHTSDNRQNLRPCGVVAAPVKPDKRSKDQCKDWAHCQCDEIRTAHRPNETEMR